MELHQGKGANQVLNCFDSAVGLLGATDSKVRAKEWAHAPRGKESVIFWSRVDFKFHERLAKIPGGFLLSSTLLGAVAGMPGVNDLMSCDWDCQKGMWAANSKGLVEQMPSNKPVYFATAMNIMEEFHRPFADTVAFKIELPALAAAADAIKFGDIHLASLNQELDCQDLAFAVDLGLRNFDNKIRLRCAQCEHCLAKESDMCLADCITAGTVISKSGKQLLRERRLHKAEMLNLITFQELKGVLTLKELWDGGFIRPADFRRYDTGFAAIYGMEMTTAREVLRNVGKAKVDSDLVWDVDKMSDFDWRFKKLDVDARGRNDQTPLHFAAGYGRPDLLQQLIKFKANLEAKDDRGRTPLLHTGNKCAGKEMMILSNAKASLQVNDQFGRTPLHMAAKCGSAEAVREMIRDHANARAKDHAGRTPLDLAKGDEVKHLLRANISPLQDSWIG